MAQVDSESTTAASPHDRERELARQQRAVVKAHRRVRQLREKAFAEIERLIAFIDACDPYVMTEQEEAVDDTGCDDTELEPSLGSFDRMVDQGKAWQSRGAADVDCELDRCDWEPNLGSDDLAINQAMWAAGGTGDREGAR